MANDGSEESIHQDLTGLVVECPELFQLEARLARFNLFKVLRADRNELRHSNVLAWLLQPDESHGLGDLFLRRWLVRVMHAASTITPRPPSWISPIEIDTAAIDFVEVRREFKDIDVVVEIHRTDGKIWVIAIENKVESLQHSAQLAGYRKVIEELFSQASCRLYFFLTKHGEEPEDQNYIATTYAEIAEVLAACLEDRGPSLPEAPLYLLRNYHQLLAEDFMSDNESTRLAQQIYHRHKRALDFIFENMVDPMRQASEALHERVEAASESLGLVPCSLGKGYIRFIPKDWDVPSNKGGKAWSSGQFLVCEVTLWTKKAELHIVSGRAPDAWADLFWDLAANPPFRREGKKRPTYFIKTYKAASNLSVAALEQLSRDEMGESLFSWLKGELERPQFKEAVRKCADLLPKLGQV